MHQKLQDFFDKTFNNSRIYDDYLQFFEKLYFLGDENVHTASTGLVAKSLSGYRLLRMGQLRRFLLKTRRIHNRNDFLLSSLSILSSFSSCLFHLCFSPVLSGLGFSPVLSGLCFSPVLSGLCFPPVLSGLCFPAELSGLCFPPVLSRLCFSPVLSGLYFPHVLLGQCFPPVLSY